MIDKHRVWGYGPPMEYQLRTFVCDSMGETVEVIDPTEFHHCPFCGEEL